MPIKKTIIAPIADRTVLLNPNFMLPASVRLALVDTELKRWRSGFFSNTRGSPSVAQITSAGIRRHTHQ
jgi:hypothetical protein